MSAPSDRTPASGSPRSAWLAACLLTAPDPPAVAGAPRPRPAGAADLARPGRGARLHRPPAQGPGAGHGEVGGRSGQRRADRLSAARRPVRGGRARRRPALRGARGGCAGRPVRCMRPVLGHRSWLLPGLALSMCAVRRWPTWASPCPVVPAGAGAGLRGALRRRQQLGAVQLRAAGRGAGPAARPGLRHRHDAGDAGHRGQPAGRGRGVDLVDERVDPGRLRPGHAGYAIGWRIATRRLRAGPVGRPVRREPGRRTTAASE